MRFAQPHSLYIDTAAPAQDFPVFTGTRTTEVAVIGGGIAGLSCALHLVERGIAVTLVEANDIGWGASGRNGGQVNAGLKFSPGELIAAFGAKIGGELSALTGSAPDLVFDLIARHRIDCAPQRAGTLRAVRSARQAARAMASAIDYAAHGAPVRFLSSTEMAAMSGTGHYLGAFFDARGGAINPLAYTRGLACAAMNAGAVIHTASKVTALRREGDVWRLTTAEGTLTARHVALCLNAYQTDLWPGLAQSQVPAYSMIAATAPLPPALRETIMPSGSVLYEQADVTVYLRLDETGRLLIGGRSPSRQTSPADYRYLQEYAQKLWPSLKGVRWTHFWNGQLAITIDHLPHLHEPAPGLTALLGCNGRGVALMTAMGARMAACFATGNAAELVLPLSPIRRIPFHRFWKLGVALRVAYGRAKDRILP